MLARRSLLAGLAALTAAPRVRAEPSPDTARLLFEQGRYLPFYREILAASPPTEGQRQMAAWVGDEARALASAAANSLTAELPADATASDALERIAAAARGRRVVMLNEAHVASRHRHFLTLVLRALRPLGFTHLAAEDFTNSDDRGAPDLRLWTAGAPFDPSFGWYMHDPVYANAVREAGALGYRFVPYEQRTSQLGPEDEAANLAIPRREQAQADNMAAFLRANPEARVLTHVGYGHLRETPDSQGATYFGARLAQASGVDPLTIRQAGSYGPHAPDTALTRAVLSRFAPTASMIVESAAGVVGATAVGADFAVFHPAPPDIDGRPGWLAADPARRRVVVRLPRRRTHGLVLVQAIHFEDQARCVPADHCLANGAREVVLYLRPGRYRLRLETVEGFVALGTVSA